MEEFIRLVMTPPVTYSYSASFFLPMCVELLVQAEVNKIPN